MSGGFSALGFDQAEFARAAWICALLALRLFPIVWLAPWAAGRPLPWLLALAVLLVLALCLFPVASPSAAALPNALSSFALFGLCARESLIGLVYGIALALPLRALEWSGRISGRLSALPAGEAVLGSLQLFASVAAFFTLGGHRLALRALADGLVQRPLGAAGALPDLARASLGSVQLCADAFGSALLIALPLALALLCVDFALALSARGAGALALPPALSALRALLALFVLWLSLRFLLASSAHRFEHGLRAWRQLFP